ncbi:helix-turn-helix domain-containing protein [Candidatus Binatus sp.]|jgi:excisionase family DNA binding protein|uniref:helix-turn-helix domain-containing protein n=1 Tax=Candidatus Binatus sp. TaxID=2811406 RepID=UPI003FA5E03A
MEKIRNSYVNGAPARLSFGLPEVAYMLGVSDRFLRDEADRHRLRFTRLGRRVLITTDELQRYLAENTDRSDADAR